MKVLGIDPGIARLGWGIVNAESSLLRLINFGCLETSAEDSEKDRLRRIFDFLVGLNKKGPADIWVIEELFFAANEKTALAVGQARGVVLLAASVCDRPVRSYTPLQVKQAMTGYGRADKKQVQTMVKSLLRLREIPQPDDAADALAIAITHSFSYKLEVLDNL